MPLTLAQADSILMEWYEQPLRESVNNEVKALKYLEQSSRQWSGRRVIFSVHLGRGNSVGARIERATLPAALNQQAGEARITSVYVYGRVQLTGQAMKATKHAFADGLAYEMENLKNDLVNDLSRQAYGDGLGTLAQVALDSNSNSLVTVFNRFFEPGQNGARYIEATQLLDAGTVANNDADLASGNVISVTVLAVSSTTADTITFSGTISNLSQSDTFLFNYDIDQVEMMGFRALIDDGTAANIYGRSAGFFSNLLVQNICATAFVRWQAAVLQNSGTERIIDSHLMQTSFDSVERNSGKVPDMIWGEYRTVSAFLDSLSGDRRFASKDFDAGRGQLTYNGKMLIADLNAPFNELYLTNKECLHNYVLEDTKWSSEDGAVLSRVANVDEFEAFLKTYRQLGVERRNGLAVIRDIRVDL